MSNIIAWIRSHKWHLIPWLVAIIAIAVAVLLGITAAGGLSWENVKAWGLAALAILVALYFVMIIRANAGAEDGSPMPLGARLTLTGYLLVFGSCLVFLLVSLNSIDFPETAVEVQEPTPSPSPSPNVNTSQNQQQGTTTGIQRTTPPVNPVASPSPSPAVPVLLRVFPQSTVTTPPTSYLTVYGQNFSKDSKVRLDGRSVPFETISDNLLKATLEPLNLVKVGSITVDVVNPGNLYSNAITVPVRKPIVPLNVFGWHPYITREVQLLLLVIFAGALGSYLHALKSLGDFIGNRTLTASWFWWYITRPFLGMAMALVFYAVLRGGFLAGTPADAKVVNPFGVIAIGALVGMFADKAAQKLGEIFEVVFKSGDPRGEKLDAPVVDRLEPATVLAGGKDPVPIKIIGDRLGKVSTVRLNAEDRKPDTVSQKEIVFKLKPEDIKTPRQIKVTAVNPDNSVSPSATLNISDLAIVTDPLPDAQADTDYVPPALTATGGTKPYTWSLVSAPKWLSIDNADNTGKLKGKPGKNDVTDINKVVVKVVDKDAASATRDLNVKVTP